MTLISPLPQVQVAPLSFGIDIDVVDRDVQIWGVLDAASAPLLLDAVAMLCRNDIAAITLDLNDVELTDTAGIAAIVEIGSNLALLGESLVLRRTLPSVRRALQLHGFDSLS